MTNTHRTKLYTSIVIKVCYAILSIGGRIMDSFVRYYTLAILFDRFY